MSLAATQWAWGIRGRSPAQKLVLLALADRADGGGLCWPSISRLITDTGLCRRSIQLAIGALEAAGLILADRLGGRHRASVYRLRLEADAAAADRDRDLEPGKGAWDAGKGATHAPFHGKTHRETVQAMSERAQHLPIKGASDAPQPITEPTKNRLGIPVHVENAARGAADAHAKTTAGTRLSADWKPGPAERDFAIGLGLDPEDVAAEFRDHWRAVPGRAGLKADWAAVYRNRCRWIASGPRPGPQGRMPLFTVVKSDRTARSEAIAADIFGQDFVDRINRDGVMAGFFPDEAANG